MVMLPLYQQIIDLTNTHKKQVLLFAQAALPESQFKAFRQLFLNEFGKSGFEKGLAKVLAEKQHKER
jgi:hypothetical protein